MGDVVVLVRVTPRAGRDEVLGADEEGVLRVRVSAPPVDGKATAAAMRAVASALDVPASAVELVSGAASRSKRLRIAGVDEGRLLARWPGLRVAPRRERLP